MMKSKNRRRGVVLIIILVCFVVAATMFAMLGRQSLAERRETDTLIWAAQSQWIAEAALERAAARLRVDANYLGETWTISAAEFGEKQGAKATIRVEKVGGSPNLRTVRAEADYPDDPVHRSRWTKEISLEIKPPDAAKDAKKP
jgi:type II secretory pathway component PulK